MIRALGMLWQGGAEIDWSGFYANQERHRVALPTYPFERESYWVDAISELSVDHLVAQTRPSPWIRLQTPTVN